MVANRVVGFCASLLMVVWLPACAVNELAVHGLIPEAGLQPSGERPQDDAVALGRHHYVKGDYGLAERHFRSAVEVNPTSTEAWLGLAAAYDRLRRFELAERAYRQVLAQVGRTAAVLNNLAYHHMLRGDLKQAGALLAEAERYDPGNPFVQGNLRLLRTWRGGENLVEQRG